MTAQERPHEPPWTFQVPSTVVFGVVGFLSRSFLYGLSKTQTSGLDRFLEILDERKDETKRTRGLLTVSNHLSVYEHLYSTPVITSTR